MRNTAKLQKKKPSSNSANGAWRCGKPHGGSRQSMMVDALRSAESSVSVSLNCGNISRSTGMLHQTKSMMTSLLLWIFWQPTENCWTRLRQRPLAKVPSTTALETQLIFDCVLIYTSLSHIIISLRGPSKLHGGAYEILQGGNAYVNLLQSCRRNFERQRKLDCLLSRIYPR